MKLTATRPTVPKPDRVVTIPVEAFAADWTGRPTAPVAVGFRRLCDMDIQAARGEASKIALRIYADDDGRIKDVDAANTTYNDALMRHAIARCTTDPNDATKTYFKMAEETVKVALTSPDGVQRFWDEYIITTRTTGVDFPPAEDDELLRLARAFKAGAVSELDAGKQAEVRKLAGWLLNQIVGAGIDIPGDDVDEDADTEDGVYRVQAS